MASPVSGAAKAVRILAGRRKEVSSEVSRCQDSRARWCESRAAVMASEEAEEEGRV